MKKLFVLVAKRGFTLMELLIVIAIVAILASFVLVSVKKSRESGRNAIRIANANQIAVAIESYSSDNNGQPPGEEGVEYTNGQSDWIPGLAPNYIPAVPSDPTDQGEHKYHYMRHGVNYEVLAFMEAHGSQPSCGDTGPGGCDYYEKGSEFLTVYNPGASGWNLTATTTATSTPPISDTMPPSVPTGLTGTTTSSSQINLTWTPSTDNVGVAGYNVFRNGVQIATTTSTSYSSTGLASSTMYTFALTSFDAAGNTSLPSDSVTTTTSVGFVTPPADTTPPSTPSGLSGTSTLQTQINLTWNASTDDVGVTGYKVYRNGVQIATASSTSYSSTGLVASTSYSFAVAAYDAAGNTSLVTFPVSVTTQTPPLPSPTTKFKIGDRVIVTANTTNIFTNSPPPGGTYVGSQTWKRLGSVIGGPISNGEYVWWQINYDSGADGWAIEDYLEKYDAAATCTPLYPFPSSGSWDRPYGDSIIWNLVIQTSGSYRIENAVARETSATVYANGMVANNLVWASSTPVSYPTFALSGSNRNFSIVASNLSAPIIYTIAVDVIDLTCSKRWTEFGKLSFANHPSNSMTYPPDATPPSAPTGLSGITISSSQINLSWNASTDSFGVTGYKIYRNGTQISTASSTSYSSAGLAPSTSYTFTVAAYDAAGNTSAQSGAVSATTK